MHQRSKRAISARFLTGFFVASILAASAWAAINPKPLPQKSQAGNFGFRPALPGYKFAFPRDHGSHPPYQTEWWYYTGHLKAADGHRFGYQLTFFRSAIVPNIIGRSSRWAARDLAFAHLALTDETGNRFYFCDRASRVALGLAGADTYAKGKDIRIWLGDWDLRYRNQKQSNKLGPIQELHAAGQDASKTSFALSLTQTPQKSPAIHGENGVSQKSAGRGHASHYYSFTRLQTSGTVRLANQRYTVTGQSWFDHEFGSSQLSPGQTGWDWFSLQLDDGRELMLYQLRLKNGGIEPYSSGTLVEKNGRCHHLKREDWKLEVSDYWTSPHSGGRYPAHWKISVPKYRLVLELLPNVADQELETKRSTGFAYWEGSVMVKNNQDQKMGNGYVELTGYAAPFNGTF